MRHPYHLVDVFTHRIFGGNPLAVFPRGDEVPEWAMPRIARELNLSETVFLLPSASPLHTRRMRIFTPAAELPFAGHPIVGTACLLATLGSAEDGGRAAGRAEAEDELILEAGVGPVRVRVRSDGGRSFASVRRPGPVERGPKPPDDRRLAGVLSLDAGEVGWSGLAPAGASLGVPFLMVPVRDEAALRRARLDSARWEAVLAGWWSRKLYLFTGEAPRAWDAPGPRDPPNSGTLSRPPAVRLRARMFAPSLGVPEDPATGSAAIALAGLLAEEDSREDGELAWSIRQGVEMGRPSLLEIGARRSGGRVEELQVGGETVMVGEGWIRVDDLRDGEEGG